jgi:Synergist-CTERM protein sorting domain-containing protein
MFWISFVAPALACSMDVPGVLEPVADPSDTVAPAAPVVGEVSVHRSSGEGSPKPGMCGSPSSVSFELTRADGDPDPEEAVGYLFDLVEGELPEGFALPDDALLGPDVSLSWPERDAAAPLAFTLSITPIDAAGNLGEAVEVDVTDPGVDPSALGCDATGGSWLGLGLLAPLFARRRRHA